MEVENRAMAHTASEMTWLKTLLGELRFCEDAPMCMYCNNQGVIYIASNLVIHEGAKHIEVNCHFVCDAVAHKLISTLFAPSSEEVADMFTKPVTLEYFSYLCNKLDMIDIYAPV